MRADLRLQCLRYGTLLLLAAGCSNSNEPGGLAAPTQVAATALGRNAVRVTWAPTAGEDVTAYEIQRRRDLIGPFETLSDAVRGDGSALVSYFDSSVEPDHYYGYRVRAMDRLGARSGLSNIAGARTAAQPGIVIRTSTSFVTPSSADADGFVASVRGPRDTTSFNVAINGTRLVTPLAKGSYTVVLRGLAVNCNPTTLGDTVKTAQVTDEGINTVGNVTFTISCRNPQKASIVTTVRTAGDTLDPDGVLMTVSGIIREAGTPANERVYFQSRTLVGANPATRFDDLRPGDYEVVISDVEAPCVLEGERKRTLQPKALAVDTVPFVLTCRKPTVPVDTAGKPFVLRQTWSATSARPGDKVSLLTALDLRATATQTVSGAAATIQFDNAVVRFDSSRTTRAFDVTTINLPSPNVISFAAAQTGGEPLSGNIEIFRSWFTVVGPVGASVSTATVVRDILTPSLQLLNSKVRAVDGDLTISTSGGGPTNQSPTAVITGPTTGTVGSAVALSGAQSTDSDGTIAAYAWNFGNGQSGSGANVSHTYAAAGTYTVRLTVTDNQGANATRDQAIVISAASATTGTVSGTITSSLGGGLAGVTVSAGSGLTASTGSTGGYAIANVPIGSRTVSVSGVPANCTTPATQSPTVTAGAATTVNFAVTCTSGGGGSAGTVSGRVTRASDGSGIGFARVVVQPTGASALTPVSTTTDGAYSVASVPVGAGSVGVLDVPAGCSAPAAQSYSGLATGATVTVNITVTCAVATTGALTGRITRSTGGDAVGVSVTVTPTGGAALSAVTSNGTGVYTVANVPAGGGTVALTGMPAGCAAPADLSYSGLVASASLTRNITLTCTAGPHTYPLTATWGAITNTGPTGRQATLTFAIDMGDAPGRPDVAGSAADPLAGITLRVSYDGTKLAYQSRTLLSPDEFDLAVAGNTGAGTATQITTIAIGSTSAQTKTGAFTFVRVTLNIASGQSGSVTPTVAVTQALATTSLVEVTSSVVVQTIPTLVIPP